MKARIVRMLAALGGTYVLYKLYRFYRYNFLPRYPLCSRLPIPRRIPRG